jgi:hypothetical protein
MYFIFKIDLYIIYQSCMLLNWWGLVKRPDGCTKVNCIISIFYPWGKSERVSFLFSSFFSFLFAFLFSYCFYFFFSFLLCPEDPSWAPFEPFPGLPRSQGPLTSSGLSPPVYGPGCELKSVLPLISAYVHLIESVVLFSFPSIHFIFD